MIQPLAFIDVSTFTANFLLRHKAAMENGRLVLRSLGEDGDPQDGPILAEWRSARALLAKIRNAAALAFEGRVPELGKVWIETVPPMSGIPWFADQGDYEDTVVRLRICLVPCPEAISFSGMAQAVLAVGVANVIDHRLLCSEANHGQHARTHLLVDVVRPDAA